MQLRVTAEQTAGTSTEGGYSKTVMRIKSDSHSFKLIRVQELCESRGGRPVLSLLMSLTVSVDVKQH